MKRPVSDLAGVRLDGQHLIQLDRAVELTFDPDSWQPDPERLEEEAVIQARLPQHLRFGQGEEAQISLVVDDPGRVDVLPADVLLDSITRHEVLLSPGQAGICIIGGPQPASLWYIVILVTKAVP